MLVPAGAGILYGEDLRHGQRIETPRVTNPFLVVRAVHGV